MRLTTATDNALLQRWRKHGDPAAFNVLIDRHAAMVHATSMRVVRNHAIAQEIAQDSFLKLAQIDRFDGYSVGGWLHRVTTNRALDVVKSEARRHARDTAYDAAREPAPSPESAAILAEIDAALAALPDDARELIILHYLEGATQKEIAVRLRVSRATVARNLQRALNQLREQLGARGVSATIAAMFAAFASARSHAAPAVLKAVLRKISLHTVSANKLSTFTFTTKTIATAGVVALLLFLAAVQVPRLVGANATRDNDSASTEPRPPVQRPIPAAQPISEPEAAPIVQPVAARRLATESPSGGPNEFGEEVVLRCVNPKGDPVANAEIYLVRDVATVKPGVFDPAAEPSESYGPFASDEIGRVVLAPFRGPIAGEFVQYYAYGLVPGKLVGAWSRSMDHPFSNDTMYMVPTRKFEGTVTVPSGVNVTSVQIRPTLVFTRSNSQSTGSFFGRPRDSEVYPVPSLDTTTPDALGRFVIENAPATGSMAFEFFAPGLARYRVQFSDQRPLQTIRIDMIPESVIFGTVRNKVTNAPVPNIEVYARSMGLINLSGNTVPITARTDHLGRYRISGLYEEKYRVYAFPIGNPPALAAPVAGDVPVGPAAEVGPIDLWFDGGGWVEGIAREKKSGTPIDGVGIWAVNPDMVAFNPGEFVDGAITQGGGRYRLYLPRGKSMLYLSRLPNGYPYPEDQGRQTVIIEAGQSEPRTVNFDLDAQEPSTKPTTAIVTGLVKDSRGAPLEGVPIWDNQKRRPNERWPFRPYLGRTNRDGQFHFSIPAADLHAIEIGGGDGQPFPRADLEFSSVVRDYFTPEADKTYDQGVVVVERYAGSIGGRVLDPSGAPLVRAEVYLEAVPDIPGFTGISDITDETGNFTVRYFPKGRYRLRASARDFKSTTVDAEQGFDYDLTLEPLPPSSESRP